MLVSRKRAPNCKGDQPSSKLPKCRLHPRFTSVTRDVPHNVALSGRTLLSNPDGVLRVLRRPPRNMSEVSSLCLTMNVSEVSFMCSNSVRSWSPVVRCVDPLAAR